MEKAVATHSSVFAWKIPWMEEPGGLPSVGLHRVGHDWSDLAAAAFRKLYFCFLYKVFIEFVTMLLLFCFGFLAASVLYYCICSPLNPYIYKMCKSNFSLYRNEFILTFYSIVRLFNMSSKFLHVDSVQFGRSVMSDSLRPYGRRPSRLLCPWDSLDRNRGLNCHFLL